MPLSSDKTICARVQWVMEVECYNCQQWIRMQETNAVDDHGTKDVTCSNCNERFIFSMLSISNTSQT